MMTTTTPQCLTCKHYRETAVGAACTAFPDGIPDDIFRNVVMHSTPIEGDNGIIWEWTARTKLVPLGEEDPGEFWEVLEVGEVT